jgi:hypothetical protein
MFSERKGISTFIATLLLMVLAVSAGVVIYAYTMGYLGGFGGTEQLGAMSIDEYSGNSTAGTISAYVRNIGKSTIEFDTLYVDGEQYLWDEGEGVPEAGEFLSYSTGTSVDQSMEEGETFHILIVEANTDDFESGKTYDVKIVAADNTQVSFSVKVD